jgi:phosphoribosylformylglycinamidine synthase
MEFLHEGRPKIVRAAQEPSPPSPLPQSRERGEKTALLSPGFARDGSSPTDILKALLGSPSIASKEWIIRQYDHEVQGGSVLKPLVGVRNDGPGDAAVIAPILGSTRGLAIGCGINPLYGDLDPYAMAAAAIDEAVRNVVAVGADPSRIALLDNFCWGDVNDPQTLGALVRACEACRDVAIAFGMPFISGKDSLNNEYRSGERHIRIPGTLLISALGIVPDVRQCVSMDLKAPGNLIYLVGQTGDELGGSHFCKIRGKVGDVPPQVDLERAPQLFRALHATIRAGLVRSCHDISEGGLAVAAAEMAFAGEVGVEIRQEPAAQAREDFFYFSESPTRWLIEVEPRHSAALETQFSDLPLRRIGQTISDQRLLCGNVIDVPLNELKAAWQSGFEAQHSPANAGGSPA